MYELDGTTTSCNIDVVDVAIVFTGNLQVDNRESNDRVFAVFVNKIFDDR